MNPEEVEPSVIQHIAQCAACQQEVARLRKFLGLMDERLYRLDCPPVETLDAYVAQELAATEMADIDAHLRDCLHCQKEVEVIRRETLAPLPLVGPIPRGEFALRGGAGESLTYTVDSLTLTLNLEMTRGQVILHGFLDDSESDEATQEALPTVRLLRLSGQGLDVTASPAAEAKVSKGRFKLGPIPYGTYQIEVELPGRLLVVGSALVLKAPHAP